MKAIARLRVEVDTRWHQQGDITGTTKCGVNLLSNFGDVLVELPLEHLTDGDHLCHQRPCFGAQDPF